MLRPAPICPTIIPTVTRIPRMQALPPHDERVLGNAVQVCHGLTPSLSYFGHCHPNARGERWGSGRWSIASQTTSPDGGPIASGPVRELSSSRFPAALFHRVTAALMPYGYHYGYHRIAKGCRGKRNW
jgi:hypothetical protein